MISGSVVANMARSSYIYAVCHNNPLNPDPPHIKAAFTVKCDLVNWFCEVDDPHKDEYTMYRLFDGGKPGVTNITGEIREIVQSGGT